MLTMKPKAEASPMTDEVSKMIALRHSAEQRGHYSPLGRLISLNTEHGRIEFPAEDGEFTGPDMALLQEPDEMTDRTEMVATIRLNPPFILLGAWLGLPAIRKLTNEPCPACRHACDLCEGTGKIVCNGRGCGGNGWVPGPWLPCPGSGCNKETGNFNPLCSECHGSGQIPERLVCPMCDGMAWTVCQRCRIWVACPAGCKRDDMVSVEGNDPDRCRECGGTGKIAKATGEFSTGKLGGSLNLTARRCPECEGNGYRFEMQAQDVQKFTNATIRQSKTKNIPARDFLVLGPIHSFELMHFATSRAQTYDVTPDAAGDFLVLLVPANPKKGQSLRAYLVGGVVREREVRAAVGA